MKPEPTGPERVCHMRRNCLLLLATFVLLPVTSAWAQGLSGALVGSVKDEQGGALEGALVRVSLAGPNRRVR